MQLPVEIEKNSAIPLQHQLMRRLRELILGQQLPGGTRLPSSRDLSKQLETSRNTVVYAYDRLIAEGYLEARERLGIFVSAQIPENALNVAVPDINRTPKVFAATSNRVLPERNKSPQLYQRMRERLQFDFRIGRPAGNSFPEKIWTRLLTEKMSGSGRRITEYGNPAGLKALRTAICDHLQLARGISAKPDQVIIVAGCEEGLNVIAKTFSNSGLPVYLEDPCYKGAAFVFASQGFPSVAVQVDGEGICVDALQDREPGLVYVTPSHQFPVGVTMSLRRRLNLLDWANRTGTYIIEDDYDSDFRYDGSPLTAIAGLDRSGSVIYVGTFSKSIGAGLRIGYLIVPEELIGPMTEAKALLNNGNPWLEQAVLAEFIATGGFRRHLRRIRQLYLKRRDALVQQLHVKFGDVNIIGENGGMHLTWLLPPHFPKASLIQYTCLQRDVGVYSLSDGPAIELKNSSYSERLLLFGYPCLSEREIETAVSRLDETISKLL